jgi:hypothetical protein
MPHRQLFRQLQNFRCPKLALSCMGVHHGRSHPIPAAESAASSASFATNGAIPRSTVGRLRGPLGKKHRRMEFVPADRMREGNGQNGLGLYDLI